MEVVVNTGAISRAKLQSNRHHRQINTQLFTGWMPFLSPNLSKGCTVVCYLTGAGGNVCYITGRRAVTDITTGRRQWVIEYTGVVSGVEAPKGC